MLFRMALVQHGDRWVVQRIRYTRIQPDRKTTGVFVDLHLGPEFKSLTEAGAHMVAVHQLLCRIEFQDQIINDPNEDTALKDQSRSARQSLLRDLYKLTGAVP